MPSCCSICCIAVVTDDWETNNSRAAALTCPASATATKYRNCRTDKPTIAS